MAQIIRQNRFSDPRSSDASAALLAQRLSNLRTNQQQQQQQQRAVTLARQLMTPQGGQEGGLAGQLQPTNLQQALGVPNLMMQPGFGELAALDSNAANTLLAAQKMQMAGAQGRKPRFTKTDTFVTEHYDEEGKPYNMLTTKILNDVTGETFLDQKPLDGTLASKLGETPDEQRTREVLTKEQTEAAKISQALSKEAFDQIAPAREKIALYDEALRALDQGADTGSIAARLPSVIDVGIELDNIQSRLGLNVIRNTTFGSLSEAELQFALSSALPQDLSEEGLRDWLNRKKAAQEKLTKYVEDAAIFLGKPGNTAVDWLELQRENQKKREKDKPATEVNAETDLGKLSTEDLLKAL